MQSRCAITGPKSVTFFHLSSLSLIRKWARASKDSAWVHPHSFSLICGYIAAKQSIATWARPYCTQLQIGSILLTMVSWDFGDLSILLFKAFFIGFSLCVCVSMYECMNTETHRSCWCQIPLGQKFIGTFELPNKDAGKWTQVFDKSSMHSAL